MPLHIHSPTEIVAEGTPSKRIQEFVGCVNTSTPEVSIARMLSPVGWSEPGQTPEFTEYTLVLRGVLRVETRDQTIEVSAGEAIQTDPGEWVRYSTPHEDAEYVAVCLPAFSLGAVHRDSVQ
ncbi:MAG: cupin domain-containing protein [Planctomycetales bacterium]|nr:cupin domain-containing protein [Planctomycetales bacterium]